MDTEATRLPDERLCKLEDSLFQAQFYVRQAMQCRSDDHRRTILRITEETLLKALTSASDSRPCEEHSEGLARVADH